MDDINIAKPTKQQLMWQDMETGMFCHFGLNTFMDREWGDGTDSPECFNPKELDCGQWAAAAKETGMKYLILTAKHHDGFCLWPTKTTEYSIKSSPWEGGKGDVVKLCAEACEKEGLQFGLYLSPWDRNAPCYADKKEYDRFYLRQLTELITNYGPLVELWFDGAGSEGREYDWASVMEAINRYQPQAMVFNMGRPTIRWVGNEHGHAPYPCWNTTNELYESMFSKSLMKRLPNKPCWLPAECDVPIRKKHWFWHPDDEHSLLSREELLDIYYKSVGHGTNLLLNVAPDDRGLLPDADVGRAAECLGGMQKRLSNPIYETGGEGESIEIALDSYRRIDHIVLMEDIAQGERIMEYSIEARSLGGWAEIVRGSAVGHKKIDKFDPVTVNKIRLNILKSNHMPIIRSIAVFDSAV